MLSVYNALRKLAPYIVDILMFKAFYEALKGGKLAFYDQKH